VFSRNTSIVTRGGTLGLQGAVARGDVASPLSNTMRQITDPTAPPVGMPLCSTEWLIPCPSAAIWARSGRHFVGRRPWS
jgi:hypothetical protein